MHWHGLQISRSDVARDFVRAKPDHDISMMLRGGCADMPGRTAHLNRSRYGPKQGGRQWADLLAETVVKCGTGRCRTDPFIFRTVVDGKEELDLARHGDVELQAWMRFDSYAAIATKFAQIPSK